MKISVVRYYRPLTLVTGSVVVALWTLLRHITNGVNFDVVGQIGLAQQWVHGLHSGAQLGATNYVLKMPLYALVNAFGFLSPMNRLLVLALICNLVTFLLLFLLFEKILKLYAVRDRTWFYLGMLWLASVAGSVYWTDYANSRNLETVGGVLFIYLMLRFMKAQSWRLAALIILTGSIVFFADSLQFYVCGLGMCLYVVFQALVHRRKSALIEAASVIGLTLAGLIGWKVISVVLRHLLHLSFLVAPHQQLALDSQTLINTAKGVVTSTLDIFGANIFKQPHGLNTIRELLSLVSIVGVCVMLLCAVPKLRKRTVVMVLLAIVVMNYAVYLASGQVLVWATSRYLVMVPLLFVLLVGASGDVLAFKHQRVAQLGWLAFTTLSCLMIAGAVITHWPERHSMDAPIYASASYLETSGAKYALSSREIAVTTTYFTENNLSVLPMLCSADHRLVPTDLFYDKAPFANFSTSTDLAPLIIPNGGITSGSAACTFSDILAQFGPAQSVTDIPGVGTAYQYPAAQLRAHLDLSLIN